MHELLILILTYLLEIDYFRNMERAKAGHGIPLLTTLQVWCSFDDLVKVPRYLIFRI